MGETYDDFGRRHRADRGGPGIASRPPGDLAMLLSDMASPGARERLREQLAREGYDLATLPDAEARRVLCDLVESGRLAIDEVPVAMLRAPVMERELPDVPEPDEPPAPDEPAEEVHKYQLVELVEIVDRGGEGTVGGAAGTSAKLEKKVDRTEKEGGAFKQFINVGRDIDGAANRHPEHGRVIELRARIEWTDQDEKRPLSGKTVKWKLVEKKHADSDRPASLVVDAEKPGLGAADETLEKTSTTDAEGWAKMRLHVSQYAGDEYTVEATLDTSDGEALGGPAKKAGPYIVWRKFWYQVTKRTGSPVPVPATAQAAFAKVGADLLAADEVVFDPSDDPKPPDSTFYPMGMIETGSADASDYAVIGGHNRQWFWARFNPEASRPVKGHLIICDAQWDPGGTTALQTFLMASKSEELTLTFAAWNSGVLKPALTGAVLDGSKWRIQPAQKALFDAVKGGAAAPAGLPPVPAQFGGALTDDHLSIPLPRTALEAVTITLPDDAPDPADGYAVEVMLKVHFGKYYAGESEGVNMLIKFNAGDDEKKYSETVAHEYGHGFGQTPDKKNSDSLPDHAKQYDHDDGHGGSGSHCSTDVTHEAVSTDFPGGRFVDGTCIMFHQKTDACSGEFCDECNPHLRLQDMSRLG